MASRARSLFHLRADVNAPPFVKPGGLLAHYQSLTTPLRWRFNLLMKVSLSLKARSPSIGLFLSGVLCALPHQAGHAQQFSLTLQPAGSQLELSWQTTLTAPPAGQVLAEYQAQTSTDLKQWLPVGPMIRGLSDSSGPTFSLSLDRQPKAQFYRVSAANLTTTPQLTASGGAAVFGYDAQMAANLNTLGLMSVAAFAARASNPPYLAQLSWDPTTARFWTNFNSNPTNSPYPHYDFRLHTNEFAIFATNGFVVSERLGVGSFGEAYCRIFTEELPVFITADSVLQAWHRTFANMLEETEELELATLMEAGISGMGEFWAIPNLWQSFGQGPLSNSILDADYFLTVANSLWAGQQAPSALHYSNVDQHVTQTLAAVASLSLQSFILFDPDHPRIIDFSQFEPRGHYVNTVRLSRYFQTMMWLSRIDLRLATFWPNQEDDIRQLGTAIVLNYLIGQRSEWSNIEQITSAWFGTTESLTFGPLGSLLTSAGIRSCADVKNLATLTNLQTRLLAGNLGVSTIINDFFWSPLSQVQVQLPCSFTVCGQKFVLDSWALTEVLFDRIHWEPSDGANVISGKVIRRRPSCLDVDYTVLGNDQVVPNLVARITNSSGVQWRDGLPYQQNLAAARDVIDGQEASTWNANLYTAWLAALRALSAPTTSPQYPEAMRTRPWGMKTLNTQMASWTELRHDAILYAASPYTPPLTCSYPAGFVEPRPEFWQRMKALADLAATDAAALPAATLGDVWLPSRNPSYYGSPDVDYNLPTVQSNQVAHLNNFAAQMATLQDIAERELAQQPLTAAETNLLATLIEATPTCLFPNFGQFTGWYPGLFYVSAYYQSPFGSGNFDSAAGSAMWDAMVADVATDLPDDTVGDPGAVLHEATGNVNLMLIAVDNGPDRMVYAGPVLSHYEFEVPGLDRLTDADWQATLTATNPAPPEWTASYLVPNP